MSERDPFGRDWVVKARCADGDPDALFVSGAQQHIAKRICRHCEVKAECLSDALDSRSEFGVWGGKTERERRALLRRYPDVVAWRDIILGSIATRSTKEIQ